MLEISNWKVYDLEESINACRYSMMEEIPEQIDFEKSLERAKKLAKCPTNSGECNFLCGIRVAYDIKYPQYISCELQRYHFNDIVTSQSKMHKLISFNEKHFNKYVFPEVITTVKNCICEYNIAVEYSSKDDIYEAWMRLLSNCPLGLELTMRCTTNYLQLRTIYHQRKNHKLKEDWGAFCGWIKSLPYAKELIIGE